MQKTIDLLRKMTREPLNIARLTSKKTRRLFGAKLESTFPFPLEMLQEFAEIFVGPEVQNTSKYPCIVAKNPSEIKAEHHNTLIDYLKALCDRSPNTPQAMLYAATLFIERHPGSLLHEFMMLHQIRETLKLSGSENYAIEVLEREQSALLEILQIHDLLAEDTIHFSTDRLTRIHQALQLISDDETLSLNDRKEALLTLECYHVSRASMLESKPQFVRPMTLPGRRIHAVSNIKNFPFQSKTFDTFTHEIKNFRFLLGLTSIKTLENTTTKVPKVNVAEVLRQEAEGFEELAEDSVYSADLKTHTLTIFSGDKNPFTKPKTLGSHWVKFFRLMMQRRGSDPLVLLTNVLDVEADPSLLKRWLAVLVEYCKTVTDPALAPSNYKTVYTILEKYGQLPKDACVLFAEVIVLKALSNTSDQENVLFVKEAPREPEKVEEQKIDEKKEEEQDVFVPEVSAIAIETDTEIEAEIEAETETKTEIVAESETIAVVEDNFNKKRQVSGTVLSKETLAQLRAENKKHKRKKGIVVQANPPKEKLDSKEKFNLTPIRESDSFFSPSSSQNSTAKSSAKKRTIELDTFQEEEGIQPLNASSSAAILKAYRDDSPISSPIKKSEEVAYETMSLELIANEETVENINEKVQISCSSSSADVVPSPAQLPDQFPVIEAVQEDEIYENEQNEEYDNDESDQSFSIDGGSEVGENAFEVFGGHNDFSPNEQDFVNQFMPLFDQCRSANKELSQPLLRELIEKTLRWYKKAKKEGIVAPTFGARDALVQLLESETEISFDDAYEYLYVILQTMFFSDKRKKQVIVNKKPVTVNPATLYPYLQNASAILMRLGNYGVKKENHVDLLKMFTHADESKCNDQDRASLSNNRETNDGTAIAILKKLPYAWTSEFSNGNTEVDSNVLGKRLKRYSQFVSIAIEILESTADKPMTIEEQWLILLAVSDYLNTKAGSPFYNAIRLLAAIYSDNTAWDTILMLSSIEALPDEIDNRTIVLQENDSTIDAYWIERDERVLSQIHKSNILANTLAMLPTPGNRVENQALCHEIKLLCNSVDLLNTDIAQWKERELCKALYKKLRNFFSYEDVSLSRQHRVLDARIWISLEEIVPQKSINSEEVEGDTQSEASRGTASTKRSTYSSGSIYSTSGLLVSASMRSRKKEEKIEVSNVQFEVFWKSFYNLSRPLKEREIKFILKNYADVSQKTTINKEQSIELLYQAFECLVKMPSRKHGGGMFGGSEIDIPSETYTRLMGYVIDPKVKVPELLAQYCLFLASKKKRGYVMKTYETKYIMDNLKHFYMHKDSVLKEGKSTTLVLREQELRRRDRLALELRLMEKVAPTTGENKTSAISLVYTEWEKQLKSLIEKSDLKISDVADHQTRLRNAEGRRIVRPGNKTDIEKISQLVTDARDKAEALENAAKKPVEKSSSWSLGFGKK